MNDHDLLVTLHERVDQIRIYIKDLKENLATRVDQLEDDHVTKTNLNDHETRIRRLEWWGAIAVGLIYAVEAYLKFINK